MPLSPLTRWLIALTLIVFVMVFVTMINPTSWFAPGSVGLALTLWTAAVFRIVWAGANLDEQAFHLTRPNGRASAFRRSTLILSSVVLLVSLMAMVRGVWFNLGWRATAAGFVITFFFLLTITGGLATGFLLSFTRTRPVRCVAWLMVALPLALQVGILEMLKQSLFYGRNFYEVLTMNLNVGLVAAASGYGLAWWLSGTRGNWWKGLGVAAIAGSCLPLLSWKDQLLGVKARPFPASQVELVRKEIPSAPPRSSGHQTIQVDVGGSLTVENLGDDEFVAGEYFTPKVKSSEFRTDYSDPGGVERQVIRYRFWNRPPEEVGTTDESQPRIRLSESGWRKAIFSASRDPGYLPLLVDSADAQEDIERLNSSNWRFRGCVYRCEHVADFPAEMGGSASIQQVGHAQVWPITRTERAANLVFRLIFPSCQFSPEPTLFVPHPRGEGMVNSHLVLVSGDGTKALVGEDAIWESSQALGSVWQKRTMKFSNLEINGWTAGDWAGARVHLFIDRPISSVEREIRSPVRP